MKKTFVLLFALLLAGSTIAQEMGLQYVRVNDQTISYIGGLGANRKEIILPTLGKYTAYKADLHVHSSDASSDADVRAKFRMTEAWIDGLDVVAITDHMSIRPVKEADQNTPAEVQAKRGGKVAKSVELATQTAPRYGMLVIPGVELTGNMKPQGHFNALFTTDNKAIYDYDGLQTLRNAREQGALIMHNHPSGPTQMGEQTNDFVKAAYAENLIDGIEVMNGFQFYPGAVDIANQGKMFVSANTDLHGVSSQFYKDNGHLRNMTIIYAKNFTLQGLREAIEARRTLAYSFGTLAGSEKLLTEFFEASVEVKLLTQNTKKKISRIMFTNKTSLPFVMRINGSKCASIKPLSSIIIEVNVLNSVDCEVLSMWCGSESHPSVKMKF